MYSNCFKLFIYLFNIYIHFILFIFRLKLFEIQVSGLKSLDFSSNVLINIVKRHQDIVLLLFIYFFSYIFR